MARAAIPKWQGNSGNTDHPYRPKQTGASRITTVSVDPLIFLQKRRPVSAERSGFLLLTTAIKPAFASQGAAAREVLLMLRSPLGRKIDCGCPRLIHVCAGLQRE